MDTNLTLSQTVKRNERSTLVGKIVTLILAACLFAGTLWIYVNFNVR